MEGLGIGRLIETMDSMKATPSCFVLALCVLWFGAPFMGASQSVNKLNVKDFAEELEVSYQLKADRPLTVQLYFSEDDGYTWRGPLKSVSGDVGPGVIPGKRKIIWNFAEEVEELWGERFRFKVKTSEHYAFSMKFREGWFNVPAAISEDFGEDKDLASFRLRQVPGWNGIEAKAPSGNYDFEMHHELSGTGVNSKAELLGYRHRPAALGMLFSAILPGSGIPYVTYGEAQNWTVEYNDRKSKKGNGNFWTIAIFGGAAALLANQESKAYDEELTRTFGTPTSAEEAAQPYKIAKWGLVGLSGLIYTTQVVKVIRWNKRHQSDMADFVSRWE